MKCARNTEADFITGRDMAIAMLAEGQALDESPAEDIFAHRGYRRGKPLNCFAEKYLQELAADPALIPGFAAVLSCDLATGDIMNVEPAYRIPMAEYLPGVVGEDGTEAIHMDGEPMDSAQPETKPERLTELESMAHDAAGEIEAIVAVAQRENSRGSDGYDDRILPMVLRRIKELNSVVMSTIGERDRDMDEMRSVVYD